MRKSTLPVVITVIAAAILIAAMIIPAMYLLSYADEQWTIGLYFRNHQEYICVIDDEVAEFNFLAVSLGTEESDLPSSENSVCYLAGYRADSFRFYSTNSSDGRFSTWQLKVNISAPESFTATEVVFETDGVQTSYDIGKAVYDRIQTDNAEYSEILYLPYSYLIGTGLDFSCECGVELYNTADADITVESLRLDFPDFSDFSYRLESSGAIDFPMTLGAGENVDLTATYKGGLADCVVILRPAVFYIYDGVRYVTHADGANVYYNSMTADYILELIKERNTDK
ncbi:MAG TPA: hypothetical protein H9693_05765 [Firmicutes bacterium]|nr:hypothetical protein [Bacillota bacterium]